MNYTNVLLMAAGLGMDTMSVSAAIGVKWHGPRQTLRLACHLGFFEFSMPIIGWAAGMRLAGLLRHWTPYVATALIFAVAAKMLYEALRRRPGEVEEMVEHRAEQLVGKLAHVQAKDPTKGWSMIALALATSLDSLLVGLSVGIKGGVSIWTASLTIGVVAASMSLLGVAIGRRAGRPWARWPNWSARWSSWVWA